MRGLISSMFLKGLQQFKKQRNILIYMKRYIHAIRDYYISMCLKFQYTSKSLGTVHFMIMKKKF